MRPAAPIDKSDPRYDPLAVVYRRFSLVHYKPKKKRQVLRRLLETGDGALPSSLGVLPPAEGDAVFAGEGADGGEAGATHSAHTGVRADGGGGGAGGGGVVPPATTSPPAATATATAAAAAEGDAEPFVGYWCPTLALSLVLDMPPFARNQVGAPFKPYLGPYLGPYLSAYLHPYLGPYDAAHATTYHGEGLPVLSSNPGATLVPHVVNLPPPPAVATTLPYPTMCRSRR